MDQLQTLDCAEQSLSQAIECLQDMNLPCKKLEEVLREIDVERDYILNSEFPVVNKVKSHVGVAPRGM